MKKTYHSLEEIRESCGNADLMACVASVLGCNKYMAWKLSSCSEDGSGCHADFVCHDEARGFIGRLSYELNDLGRFGQITVEAYQAPTKTG